MRAAVCAIAAAIVLAAHPAAAQPKTGAAFWASVQARCDATARQPASELGKRIAKNAIAEFDQFSGHKVDANGRLFHFGLTEAEQGEEHGGDRPTRLGDLGWWQVMKYWRALYGSDIGDKLEALGYRDATGANDDKQAAALLRMDIGELLRAADAVADPDTREVLREAALRAAVTDTPWSAAFISYVVREAGVSSDAFHFSNAHRTYIYDAFATSAAELTGNAGERLYRACSLATTTPRVGDLICFQREPSLAGASDKAVRERIRAELEGRPEARTVRRTHCDVVAHIDAPARKLYSIGGNLLQGVTAKKLNLRQRGLKFSLVQKGDCGGSGYWTLPENPETPQRAQKCSLNDRKWFVLLQLR